MFECVIVMDNQSNYFAVMEELKLSGEQFFKLMDKNGIHEVINERQVQGYAPIELAKCDDSNSLQILIRSLGEIKPLSSFFSKKARQVEAARLLVKDFNNTTKLIKDYKLIK